MSRGLCVWLVAVLLLVSAVERPCLAAKGEKNTSRVARTTDHITAEIDRLIDERLAADNVPASPPADDATFLRRVTIDLTGRIPTFEEATAFLDSDDPDRRAALIADLLARESYGLHFGTIWKELIEPRDMGSTKVARDTFTPWLASQFNQNRGWNEIVTSLLTAEGRIRERPESQFIIANSVNFEPQPGQLADATARLFWGVQLGCAECHDHPFAAWQQTEFWATAAFFSRLRKGYSDGKNPQGWTLTELAPDDDYSRQVTVLLAAQDVPGPAIKVPDTGGKLADKVVNAKYLGGDETGWTDHGPFLPRFAEWATGASNPWFAKNTVNRLWAHLFGHGLITPLDGQGEHNQASHPELLDVIAAEFIASDFDQKHLLTVLCNSRAYQRSSGSVSGNELDTELFSHMSGRLISPTTLYDSLSIVLYPVAPKSGAGKKPGPPPVQLNPIPGVDRYEFLRFFMARPDENTASVMNQGIPQFLRLMNGPVLNESPPGLARFLKGSDRATAIDSIFLAAYSRRPTKEEVELARAFIENSSEPEPAAGLLWALLNSSEFVVNH